MKRTALFYKIVHRTDPTTTEINAARNRLKELFDQHPDTQNLNNATLFVQKWESSDNFFFGSLGKMGDDKLGTFERGREKANPENEAELTRDDDKLIEKYTFFYIDYVSQILCILKNNDCNIKTVTSYINGFINLSTDDETLIEFKIIPLSVENFEEKIEELGINDIKLVFDGPLISRIPGIRELASSLPGVREISIKIKLSKRKKEKGQRTFFNQRIADFVNSLGNDAGLKSAQITGNYRDDDKNSIADLIEESFTKKIEIEVPYERPINETQRRANSNEILHKMQECTLDFILNFQN